MKKTFLLLLTITTMLSCNVDNSDDVATPVDPVNPDNSVQVDINGSDFASTNSNTFAQITNESNLRIFGGDGNANLEILITGYTGTGLYSIEAGDPNISLSATYTIPSQVNAPDRVWTVISDPTSPGQVTITAVNANSIEGNFTFTATNEDEDSTLVFSGGNFTVEIQ